MMSMHNVRLLLNTYNKLLHQKEINMYMFKHKEDI
jgi:hypothetical protein